jgi:hypothetical protein
MPGAEEDEDSSCLVGIPQIMSKKMVDENGFTLAGEMDPT